MKGKTQGIQVTEFKERCKAELHCQPSLVVLSFLKEKSVDIDTDLASEQDLPCIQILLKSKIHGLKVYQNICEKGSPKKLTKSKDNCVSHKIRQFLQMVNKTLERSQSLRWLRFERVKVSVKEIRQLQSGLRNTKSLKELGFTHCGLVDAHIEQIKESLAFNQSLINVDFSNNSLEEVGGKFGKILSEHSRRRNDRVWIDKIRGETVQDLSNLGICQLNLQGNNLCNKAVNEFISFIRADSWTKCINLRKNKIGLEGIKQFVLLMKENTSLIFLDLRENEGLLKDYSRFIYRRLVLNMEKYKKAKGAFEEPRQQKDFHSIKVSNKNSLRNQNSAKKSEKSGISHKKNGDFSEKKDPQKFIHNQLNNESDFVRGNMTALQPRNDKSQNTREMKEILKKSNLKSRCLKCEQLTLKCFRIQKSNFDLQLQLKKLKHVLQMKNIDLSLPEKNSRQEGENEDDLLQRMEVMMLNLTKIMQAAEDHQQTHVNLTSPLLEQGNNSQDNTIPLYKQEGMDILSREIGKVMEELDQFEEKEENQSRSNQSSRHSN